MGKKERIEELEKQVTAHRSLLEIIGAMLEVSTEEPLTMATLGAYVTRFTCAIKNRPDEDDDDDVGLVTRGHAGRSVDSDEALDEFEDMVDEETHRVGRALVPSDGVPASANEGLAAIGDIARELGLPVDGLSPAESLVRIHQEILKIKSPGDIAGGSTALAKGDSLADAVRHGRQMEHDLRDSLRDTRMALNRIAAAMQLEDWDKHGDQIVARIAQYEAFKHYMNRRISHMCNDPLKAGAVTELRAALIQFMGEAPALRFLGKMPPQVAGSASAVAATALHSDPSRRRFVSGDLLVIRDALDDQGPNREERIQRERPMRARLLAVFDEILHRITLTEDVVTFLNVVVAPLLPQGAER